MQYTTGKLNNDSNIPPFQQNFTVYIYLVHCQYTVYKYTHTRTIIDKTKAKCTHYTCRSCLAVETNTMKLPVQFLRWC